MLLLRVGMEMDLGELGAVGRRSLLVAAGGVALPFAGGWAVATRLGHGGNVAIFVGAALTATSVGITARVFGDLRAVATVEARTVLGAAVADDALGLVILTVVVRVVSEGSVSVLGVAGVLGLATAFLVAVGGLALRLAPPLFGFVTARARSAGTAVCLALAFALAVAELAVRPRCGPARPHPRCWAWPRPCSRRPWPELGAALAVVGSPGDKLLIGVGMLPRGEVGLIFAGLGRREGCPAATSTPRCSWSCWAPPW